MQKNQTDEGLNFKKRARRRLVGAIALVFLMIIILPMILEDRESSPPQEEVEIIMPDQEESDFAVLDDGGAMTETLAGAVVVEEETVTAQVIELPKTKTTVISPESKVIEKPKIEKTKVETKKPAKPVKVKKEPVKVAVVEKVNNANDKFYVQIGVFSEIANVEKLQSKLNDLGYQSVTEEITTDKGVKTRLRTETFVGRNEAAIALENIKDSGLTGMVVSQK